MGNRLTHCDTGDNAPVGDAEPAPEPVEEEPLTAEEEEVVEEEETKPVYPKKPKFWHPPPDPRFRSTNQARTCYTRYNEFYKCKLEKDEDSEECMFYKRCYEAICPQEWIERWEELREEGLWAGRY